MHNRRDFDVLVVYTAAVAISAANLDYVGANPFPLDSSRALYNRAYAYLLNACRKLGLTAAFSTSGDIVGPGMCSSYWTYQKRKWKKVRKGCFSRQIFDKFSPLSRTRILERELLFSNGAIEPFNAPWLTALFFDKQQTYLTLEEFAIPTVAIENRSVLGVGQAVDRLRTLTAAHNQAADFTQGIVVKDRHGAGGEQIYKVDGDYVEAIYRICSEHSGVKFILQPFLRFDKGFALGDTRVATDIRLIYQNGRVIQTYLRTAKAGDFRCNEHQGGTCVYVTLKDIPEKVMAVAGKIAKTLEQDRSLYALDFVMSNRGNVYFLEGNIGPGIYWGLNNPADERMSKRLIEGIAMEFAERIERMLPMETIDESITPLALDRLPLAVRQAN